MVAEKIVYNSHPAEHGLVRLQDFLREEATVLLLVEYGVRFVVPLLTVHFALTGELSKFG